MKLIFLGTFPSGDLSETEETAVYHTIAIEHDRANGQMVVEFDGLKSAIALTDIRDFNSDDFQYARIRTEVRNINEPGDAGSIQVKYDDVMVNGEAYDNFTNGFGVNNWHIQTV